MSPLFHHGFPSPEKFHTKKSTVSEMLAAAPTFVIPPRKASAVVNDEPAHLRRQREFGGNTSMNHHSSHNNNRLAQGGTMSHERNGAAAGPPSSTQAVPMRTTSSKRKDHTMVQSSNSVKSAVEPEPVLRGGGGGGGGGAIHIPARGRSRSKPEPISKALLKDVLQNAGGPADHSQTASQNSFNANGGSSFPQHAIPPRRAFSPPSPRTSDKQDIDVPAVSWTKRTTSKKSGGSGNSRGETEIARSNSDASMTSIIDAYTPSRTSSKTKQTISPQSSHNGRFASRPENQASSANFTIPSTTNGTSTAKAPPPPKVNLEIPARRKEYPTSILDHILNLSDIERAFATRAKLTNSTATAHRKSTRSLSVDTNPMNYSILTNAASTTTTSFSNDAADAMRESVASLQESILEHLRRSVVDDMKRSGFGHAFRASTYSSMYTDEAEDAESRWSAAVAAAESNERQCAKNLVIPKRGESSNVGEPGGFGSLHGEGDDYSFVEGDEEGFETSSACAYDAVMDHVMEFLDANERVGGSSRASELPSGGDSGRTSAMSGAAFMGTFQKDLMKKLRIVKKMMEDAKLNAAQAANDVHHQRKGSADSTHSAALRHFMRGRKGSIGSVLFV
ncbi:hypothetical protein BJ741DRAFT_622538 [Chytriomyces cf. hyalinus JEL632]|nr:hypothetical protein BJ741DRAFT_622538 [Chytriomyces cf. hyalinus JEL632]